MLNKQPKLTHLVVLLGLSVFAFSTHSTASQKDGLLKIYFFDVGQGDSIFIEAPNGNQVLIDGGPDNKVVQELAKVMPFYDREIDMVIVSHPHADHIAGLIEVLKRYDVRNILEAKEFYKSPVFPVWHDAESDENANLIEAKAGQEIDFGNEAKLTVLYPNKSYDGIYLNKPHQANVVAMLTYKNFRLLLTGDMEKSVEDTLISGGLNLNADILKIGHHGSKTSTTSGFLSAVSPEVAFIQVGKNRYGHPAPEILKRLSSFGIKNYRTDLDGHMEVLSDGETYEVKRY